MMSKIYLDECYFCHEGKAAIKHSQSIRDPIFCVGMSGYESPEVDWERDRHCFVVTNEQIKADQDAAKKEGEFWARVFEEEQKHDA